MKEMKKARSILILTILIILTLSCGDETVIQGGEFSYEYYLDQDLDGFGAGELVTISTTTEFDYPAESPDGYSILNTDCNDQNPNVFPGAIEFASNDQDDNCDGVELENGHLIITEIMYDPSAVDDAFGEWFEIYNASPSNIQLFGWVISTSSGSFTISDSLVIPNNNYLVLGANKDPSVNGGVSVAIEYGNSLLLNNVEDFIRIEESTEASQVDQIPVTIVAYNEQEWPEAAGATLSLGIDHHIEGGSYDSHDWCVETLTYGDGDKGTPGEANGDCN